MLAPLTAHAGGIAHAAPHTALVSNLSGALFPAGSGPDAGYWARHAREPVRFAACIETLRASGVQLLVEIGPHPTLLGLAARAVPDAPWTSVASLRRGRDDRHEMATALAAVYARGAAIRWDAVEGLREGRHVALPTYPFQRERHWIAASAAQPSTSPARGHPLLGERRELAASAGTFTWACELALDSHPWLADHRVQGVAIVPATAYIEMALAAGHEVLSQGSLSVRDIENLKPIVLNEGDRRELQASLTLLDGTARFAVHSRPAGSTGTAWTQHAAATLRAIESPDGTDAAASMLEAARQRCGDTMSGTDFYLALARKGNQWGPDFQGVEALWIGDGEAVGRIAVAPGVAADTGRYRFHPAVSDACGHPLVATVPLQGDGAATSGAFVGGGVAEVRFHRSPAGSTLWTHATRAPAAEPGARVVLGDLRVYDETGALVSETLGARLWYLDERSQADLLGAPPDWFYRVAWQDRPASDAPPGPRAAGAGPWIVFADRAGVGECIAAAREGADARTLLVTPGTQFSIDGDHATLRPGEAGDYRRLVEVVGAAAAVVHLWSLDAGPHERLAGTESLLHLLHALRGASVRAHPRLWICTRGAQAAGTDGACDSPWSAAAWGLGRSLSAEHPDLWGGLIDLAPQASPDESARQVAREVLHPDAEDQLAFRFGRRFAARLDRRPARHGDQLPFAVRDDSTYLVTGGLGGIGLAIAGWLVERGARHLLLLGRTPLPAREQWLELEAGSAAARRAAAVAALEAQGARVETAALDVAAEGPLEALLAARRGRGEPQVRGVFHAAGVLRFEPLESQTVQGLREAVAAKVDGAWRLHRLFEGEPLDVFMTCSSSSVLLASPLLGAYAAGNAFLDALAHHRRARGLAALSVDWGTWGEVGMAVESGQTASADMLRGVGTISTAQGLAALAELLAAGDTRAAVMPIDWAELARTHPALAADPFLGGLTDAAAIQGDAHGNRLSLAALREVPEMSRPERIATYLRGEAALVLGLSADTLPSAAPLASLGFDSLMAVQLKNRIEADLRLVLPMIHFLQGPSVEELAQHVLAGLDLASPAAEAEAAGVDHGAFDEGSL